nr:leucine-rich repeat-containing protein 20 isoform X1 [Peromyscus maniculatus bairdii]XP_042121581.1 leucine-rich repeat-containing protein 20 isoform X1 [Peromyscus maniculatus bairdii]XP_042121582.1 leucine-rich repeat-containing protein 20 isoform X1 [Peromyscus maniculatus bairdii]
MLRKMGEAVARVARKVNETVESSSDTLDLADCKLVSFPICIYKVLRNVSDQIHLITLANNELKSLTSKFMTTFSQLRELRLEGNYLHRLPNEVSGLQHLKAIDLSRNQFQDFPEQLTTLPELETINLEENEIVVPVCHAGTSQNGASSPARSRMSPERADAHWSLCVLICLALSSPGPISPSHCVSVIHGCSSGGSHMASSPLQLHSDFSQVFFLWPFMPLDKRQWPSEWFGLWQGNVLCGSQCLCIQDAVCGQDF